MTAATTPTKARMLWWGFTKRCPRCGQGNLFLGWFTIASRCPRCRLHFEREEGYWTGALAINVGVTTAVFAVFFVAALALTVPDVPVVPLLAVLVPVTVVVPIVYYPFSKTVWMAVDRAVLQHLDPHEPLDQRHRRR